MRTHICRLVGAAVAPAAAADLLTAAQGTTVTTAQGTMVNTTIEGHHWCSDRPSDPSSSA